MKILFDASTPAPLESLADPAANCGANRHSRRFHANGADRQSRCRDVVDALGSDRQAAKHKGGLGTVVETCRGLSRSFSPGLGMAR